MSLEEILSQELVDMESIQRNTAYKVWIADLVSSKYFRGQEKFDSGYIDIKGNKISRVNIVGGIIDKFSGNNYVSVSLDDGSGVLRLKSWNEGTNLFLDVNIGDLVLIVGKIKEYNNNIYVAPEFLRKLDNPLWLKVRKLELVKIYGEAQRIDFISDNTQDEVEGKDEDEFHVLEEKVEGNTNSREFILSLIEKLDFGDGADLHEITKKSGFEEAGKIVEELLRDGEIFELHKGKLRVIG